jgi:Fe-S-cluster containining protein
LPFEYPRRLHFQCDKCALCCGDTKERVRMILLLKSEAHRIRLGTRRNLDEFADRIEGFEPYVYSMKKTLKGNCLFLDNNLCSIYDLRPLVCKFYPFELKDSGKNKYVFKASNECPRLGTGNVLKEEIFERLFKEFMDAMKEEVSYF